MKRLYPVLFCLALMAATTFALADAKADMAALAAADKLFTEQNYREAADAYDRLTTDTLSPADWHRSRHRAITSRLNLKLYEDVLADAERYIVQCAGTPFEARAERLLGNLYMSLPHYGTRSGGKFTRGVYQQGVHLTTVQHDKRHALRHMERARLLYAHYDANPEERISLPEEENNRWREEYINCLFYLSAVCAQFGIYDNDSQYWYYYGAERDDELAEQAGETDFEERYSDKAMRRNRPIGLQVDAAGLPVFPVAPEAYSENLTDDEKILYLLGEIAELDPTPERHYAARSVYRQAMLSRIRFGMTRLEQYGSHYYEVHVIGEGNSIDQERKQFDPWTLEDNQALILAGGKVRVADLPEAWDVLGLLRRIAREYPDSDIAWESAFAVGACYQSRQQYVRALAEYEALLKETTEDNSRNRLILNMNSIQKPQAAFTRKNASAQYAGEPARLEVEHRNMERVWFSARRIHIKDFLKECMALPIDPEKGFWGSWHLPNWPWLLVNYHDEDNMLARMIWKHVEKEAVQWSEEVPGDPEMRLTTTVVNTPLTGPGAWYVCAFTAKPSDADVLATGTTASKIINARTMVFLSDLALVEKKVKEGNLYFVCDARTGEPVAGADVNILELSQKHSEARGISLHEKHLFSLTTDERGMAVQAPSGRGGSLFTLATAGDGSAAWMGMTWWTPYHPSSMESGAAAYCVTDRPVYRPGQEVHFHAWRRDREKGRLINRPGASVGITIYDPRGNTVHETRGNTDTFGGYGGTFRLDKGAPLGMYRIHITDANSIGEAQFRVEEYKKPEFEVTVTPGKSHAKLGETVEAVISAGYYFGAPVTDGTVTWKVFREEFNPGWFFPMRWDWLYGPGYGLPWYEYGWLPWWNRCLRPAPAWWGYTSPVRELVTEGEGPLDENGALPITIDTAPALKNHPDRDHRYIITAEVRDQSRRVINGEGAINVTRTSWFARIETERGYWRPGEEITAHVQCLTPDLQPTQAEGVITIREITFEGPGNAQVKEEVLRQWKEKTDEEGRISIRLSREKSGLLDISFEAPDHWGGTVEARTVAWVCGPDFNGARYRFNNLEIITDKREYRPGEVAHVMINTARPNSSVIFADEVDQGTLISWRLMRIEGSHTIVDIPVTEEHQPNFYIEAMTVSDMQVYQQAMQVCVPPEESAMEVCILPDKEVYKPGEKARVAVKATTLDGRPLRAGLVMTVFDRALTYIQQETAASITAFFHGRLRSHWTQMTSSLSNTFFHYGGIREPSYVSPAPMEWSWPWTPLGEEWRAAEYAEIDRVTRWQAGGSVSRGDVWKTKESGLSVTASSARDSSWNFFAAPQSVAYSSLEMPATPEIAMLPVDSEASPEGAFAEAHTRTRFADTALWTPVVTDEDGTALVEFDMPENLTDWRMRAWGITEESRTGEGDGGAKTSKNLLVRLQAPRFFMERDEVVISANIHNYLDSEKRVRASLDIPEDILTFMEGVEKETDIVVPAGGEARADWRVRVLKEGEARVRVQALTDEESDAMEMPFPVLVHGILKQETSTGIMRADQTEGSAEIRFSVPEMRRPEQTRLEVRFAPTLVMAMLDALPYCLEYPYGCTEQTMSRFMPAVLTLKTLQNMGVNLEELKQARGRLEEVRKREADQRYTPLLNPVFETEKMREIIREGLSRIEEMRNGDGGWGWWSKDRSSPWLTAYVVYALHTASECDVAVNQDLIESGMNFLMKWEEAELVKPEWRPSTLHADVAHVLSLKGLRAAIKPAEGDTRPPDAVERLHEGRAELNHYGKALLAMALHRLKNQDRAWLVLRNLSQYLEQNEETQTAFLRNPQGGWWHWWNSDIETNAAFLRALVLIQPDHPAAPRLVKWLLNNRKNGYYWRSTRDTALCIAALSDFALAAGETSPDYTLIFDLDNGAVVKKVRVNSDNLFTFDNRFIIEGAALGGGEHTLKITREGTGAVYFTNILQYFTMEEGITAAGHEIKVERTCYLLEKIPAEAAVEDSEGRVITEGRLRYRRILLKDGDTVKSGDLVQVELRLAADNDYTYLCLEDMKPAGCEPTEVTSGGTSQEGFWTWRELRDEKVVFFLGALDRGEHLVRYRLRAEIPGVFHTMPTIIYGMYSPELRANAAERILKIMDAN